MLDIRIDEATLEDLPEILKLQNAGAVGVRAGSESDDITLYEPAFERIRASDHDFLYVSRLADVPVAGTFQLTFLNGLGFRGGLRAQVESVHTREDLRGRGVGAHMMAFALEEARRRNCCLAQLTSNSQRTDAHRFYKRLGFEQSHIGMKFIL